MAPDTLTLRRPDDWHVHLRDGAMMAAVLPYTARQFARAIIMPNLAPPVTTVADAEAYRARILKAVPAGVAFTPLMTAYLSDHSDPNEIERGHRAGVFTAAKLYPAHATTHSAHGVTDIAKIGPTLERMADIGMPLLVHGEVTDPAIDIFDREAVFIERVLAPLTKRLPELKIVLEHITTKEAADFIASAGPNLAATITAHHLVISRNALFAGGLRPHMYCLPVAKRETHRLALRRAAVSGGAEVLPRHRHGAASCRRQGARLRLRRHLQRARRHSRSTRRYSTRKTRSTVSRPSPRSTARASMVCRPMRRASPCVADLRACRSTWRRVRALCGPSLAARHWRGRLMPNHA